MDNWEADALLSLDATIKRALNEPQSQLALTSLQHCLIRRKADFTKILFEPRQQQQQQSSAAAAMGLSQAASQPSRYRQDLQEGFVTINGSRQRANKPFCVAVGRLADLLSINESRAASVYSAALLEKSSFGDVTDIEVAVLLYYREREMLLSCVEQMILAASPSAMLVAANEPRRLIQAFISEIMTVSSSQQQSLPSRLIELLRIFSTQINTLAASIDSVALAAQQQQQQQQYLAGIAPQTPSMRVAASKAADPEGDEKSKFAKICLAKVIREQYYVVSILHICAHEFGLTGTEFIELLQLLSECDTSNNMLPFLLNVALAQLDHAGPACKTNYSRFEISEPIHRTLSELVISAAWRDQNAQAVVWLSWVYYLHDRVRCNAIEDQAVRFQINQELDGSRRTWDDKYSKVAGVYLLLNQCLLHSSTKRPSSTVSPLPNQTAPGPSGTQTAIEEADAHIADIVSDFASRAITVIDTLVCTNVARGRRTLRASLSVDQDTASSNDAKQSELSSRGISVGILPANNGYTVPAAQQQFVTSWEAHLQLITDLYRDRSDAAQIWFEDPDLYWMLRIGGEFWTPRFIIAFLDMLASIASGPICASKIHQTLDQSGEFGQILWSTFFRTLNSYIERMSQPMPTTELHPAEVALITAFLRLISQVVRHSFTARRVLCENQHFRALETLFRLLVSRIHVEMKAAILATIAAFCTPSDQGGEIVSRVWVLIEQTQIVPTLSRNVVPPPTHFDRRSFKQQHEFGTTAAEGIAYDLLEIETSMQTYPETLAFLDLLSALLSNPQSKHLLSIYESLGAPERVPGINPYIRFVLDGILLRATDLPFANPGERWRMIKSCLNIVQLSVSIFDMSELEISREVDLNTAPAASTRNNGVGFAAKSQATSGAPFQARVPIRNLVLQPGFEIISRTLQGSKFAVGLFNLLNYSVRHIENAQTDTVADQPVQSIVHILGVLNGIFELQRLFLEALAPALILLDPNDRTLLNLPVSMVGLDQLLAYNHRTVVDIAVLVGNRHTEISISAIKLLKHLSVSPVFTATNANFGSGFAGSNRLASLIIDSEDSNRILQGFVDHLRDVEEPEQLQSQETSYTSGTTLGNLAAETTTSIRRAILDLLLINLSQVHSRNLAHFLLGFDCQRDLASTELVNPAAPKGRTNCLHIILQLLSQGIPKQASYIDQRLDDHVAMTDTDSTRTLDAQTLSTTHPELSDMCFHLIYLLCSDSSTGPPMLRYLRTSEDFFVRQLHAMDLNVGEALAAQAGVVSDVHPSSIARLHQQAWIMRLIALELHTTALTSQKAHTVRLLNCLIGLGSDGGINLARTARNQDLFALNHSESSWDALRNDRDRGINFDQPLAKLLDVLKFMNLEGAPIYEADSSMLSFGLQPDRFVRRDERGIDQYDLRAIWQALSPRLSERQAIVSNDNSMFNRDEIHGLFDTVFAANNKHRLTHARFQVATAWGQLVHIAVLECFELIPAELRELRIFELLASLLSKLAMSTTSMSIGKVLSEVVTGLMSRLQQDSYAQSFFKDVQYPMDPSKLDSWQQMVLRGILDGIVATGTSLAMRGNYYATLIAYIQYVTPAATGGSAVVTDSQDPLAHLGDGVQGTSRFLASLAIISSYGDSLIETICSDASDGELIWQTVAFATLANLCNLCNLESSIRGAKYNPILEFLVRRNYLSQFVQSLKTVDDVSIRTLLNPASDAYEGKYVYDLRMSLFLKLAESKAGADRLINNGLLETLSELQFIDHRPDAITDDKIEVQDRYHDAFVTALSLVLQIQSHYHSTNAVVRLKFGKFISSHREVFSMILRERSQKISLQLLVQMRLVTGILVWMRNENQILLQQLSGSGQPTFDDLMLQLLQKLVLSSDWRSSIVPLNDIEIEKSRTVPAKVLAHVSAVSVFALEVEATIELIAVNLLSYWVEKTLPRSEVVPKPFTTELRSLLEEQSVALLLTYGNKLLQTLNRRKTIQMKVSDIAQVPVDEINEIVQSFNRKAFEELSPSQRQAIALHDLKDTEHAISKDLRRLQ
eukprot:jgi/Hompol1/3566/HPOL_001619-RA